MRYLPPDLYWRKLMAYCNPKTKRMPEVSRVVSIIRDEHRSVVAVLQGMKYLVKEIREHGASVDLKVFWAMLHYLDSFTERMHHPKEDRYLFSILKKRTSEAGKVIAELEADHAAGEQALRRLEQCLVRYQTGGVREFQSFAEEVERYAQGYREHLKKEEEIVLPLAEKALSAEDWAEIDRAFEENRDPLASDREYDDFYRLFRRIVNLAPPPIGVGPGHARG